MIDQTNNDSFWYFDEKGMILERLGWGEDGKGDAVGRNAFEYICRPNESFLKESILRCIKVRDDSYVQFYRYPDEGAESMSRDHVGSIILALYINRDFDELDFILKNLPWRISRKHTQTIDFWLWHRILLLQRTSLCNLAKLVSYVFLVLTLIQFVLIIPWNWIVRKILSIKMVDPHNNPVWQRFAPKSWKWYLHKTLYPHFSLFLLAWQIRVLPASLLKQFVQCMLRIESANIVIDAVLGKPISIDRWKSFKPTTSFIWARRMDSSNDILIVPLSEKQAEFNDINRSMLDYLYFGIDRIMIDSPEEIVRSIKTKKQIITY